MRTPDRDRTSDDRTPRVVPLRTGSDVSLAGPAAIILRTLAHDLRGKLTSIIGASRLMLDHPALTEFQRTELLEMVLHNGLATDHILHEMIDLQRFDAAGWVIHRRPTDVRALIERLAPAFELGARSLTIVGDVASADVDPGLLERIIENLIQNAVAHTPDGSPITVTIDADEDGVRIGVRDAGSGVPDRLKRAIFDDFHSEGGGSGMGLALVRRFAELHGGRAWVEDAAGGGASFNVDLPGGDAIELDPPAKISSHRN